VRGSHGGTRDGVGAVNTTNPSGGDASAGGEDVAAGAEAGEGGAAVVVCSGHDSVCKRSRGRGGVAGVVVGITSSHGHDQASAERGVCGIVDSLVAATTEGHVANDLATKTDAASGPVDSVDDTCECTRAIGAEHLNTDNIGLASKTEASACSSRCDMGAVAIAIEETLVGGVEEGLAGDAVLSRAEISVVAVNTSVDDININTTACSSASAELVGDLSDGG